MDFDTKKFEEKTLSREKIFDGKIFQVVRDKVSLPDGNTGFRELVFHNGGVAVAPVIGDKMLLVGQYRKAIEQFIYEIPAGKLELGENSDTKAAALRELEEETGYSTKNLIEIAPFYVSPGCTSEITYLYFSSELEKVDNPRPQDDDEFLESIFVTLDEAKKLTREHKISDAKTIMAIQYWEIQQLKAGESNA